SRWQAAPVDAWGICRTRRPTSPDEVFAQSVGSFAPGPPSRESACLAELADRLGVGLTAESLATLSCSPLRRLKVPFMQVGPGRSCSPWQSGVMDRARVRELLSRVAAGVTDVDTAVMALVAEPFQDLGFARLDTHRAL